MHLAAFLIVPSLATAWPFCPDQADHHFDAPTAKNLDLNYVFGDWFEVINTGHAASKCARHTFAASLANSTNSSRELEWWAFDYLKHFRYTVDGPAQFSLGRCEKGKENGNSMRVVHDLISGDIMPFWIYKTGPVHKHYTGDRCEVYRSQYEYLIVSNWEQYPVVVLVRNLEVFRTHHEREVMQYLASRSFPKVNKRAFDNPLRPDYSSCPEYTKNKLDKAMKDIQRYLK